ncbi:phosphonoacetaldehyde hydrolase [Limnoglobus roseus]|uniref:Phosphonoacetaldehyde hydrolase n=1 Tax=Limnoglobus roseus TaxID=2598579 RepID=A0A5C1AAY2_9BACT|nr:phosphonoacetaldehyde hydrolase [Limnoglobus roseus]QEL15377.1 phosphonoacetaldehyde hydrolase [Limnoglobus roseus]
MPIQLVVFDWAGTIIDFGSCAPVHAFHKAFATKGIAVTMAETRRPMGLHKKDHIREMLKAMGRPWTEAEVEELYQIVTPMQLAGARECARLIPGVPETARLLRERGLKIGTTTGYFHAALAVCLSAAKEQGFEPDAAVCADDVPQGRPAPWMMFRVMEKLNVYPPKAVVKVGDTPIDMAEARSAGTWALGVVDSSNEMGLTEGEFAALAPAERERRRAAVRDVLLDAGADGTIDTLAELPEAIEAFEAMS